MVQPRAAATHARTSVSEATPLRLIYEQVPNPLADGAALAYDEALAEYALDAGARGAPILRTARGPEEPPNESGVQRIEAQLRRRLHARARDALGRAFFWSVLGPTLSLVWVNFSGLFALPFFWFPPLAVFVATLGASSGGAVLSAVVGMLPLIWCWSRAWQHVRRARYWRRLARFAGSKRFRSLPVDRVVAPDLAAFWRENGPLADRLRAQIQALPERGPDGVAEAAQISRTLHIQAAQRGLAPAARLYHLLYTVLAGQEPQITRIERSGDGILTERKIIGAIRKVRTTARRSLAHVTGGQPVSAHLFAPAKGLLLGLFWFLVALVVTGTYYVPDDHAVLISGPEARLAMAMESLGAETTQVRDDFDIVRQPGFHWSLPEPFVSRHTVTLGAQRLLLRAPFRQVSPDVGEAVFVELAFRITDVERWAQLDRAGTGTERLASGLSEVLEAVIQRSRVEARQAVIQQTPSLGNDEAQATARADQLVQQRMEDVVRLFIAAVNGNVREQGIQLAPEARVEVRRVQLVE
ncbi:MAG TPA: hypothetical protein VGW38_12430, partial [Chloroflexota bacterium]|nr:hypothetical protein [Chloroflexota bacterium]